MVGVSAPGASGQIFDYVLSNSPEARAIPAKNTWSRLPLDSPYRKEWDTFARLLGVNSQDVDNVPLITDALQRYAALVVQARQQRKELATTAKSDSAAQARAALFAPAQTNAVRSLTAKNGALADLARVSLASLAQSPSIPGFAWGISLQSVTTNPKTSAAFYRGVAQGMFHGAKDMVVGLATFAGKTAQYGADMTLGIPIDGLRSLLPSGTQAWLRDSELIPSAERGLASSKKIKDAASAMSNYIANRSAQQVASDISGFIEKNWDSLKSAHTAAVAQGPQAEALWWGQVTGRAVFELAVVALPVAKAGQIVKAGEALDVARSATALANVVTTPSKVISTLDTLASAVAVSRLGGGFRALLNAGRFSIEELTELARAGKLTATEISDVVSHLGVKTPRDQLVLWSGLGPSGSVRAATYAAEAGGVTLEMTRGGRWLDDLKLFEASSPVAPGEAVQIWEKASRSLAEQASGQVRVVRGAVRPRSVYWNTERPALANNPSVIGIEEVFLKPKFGVQ